MRVLLLTLALAAAPAAAQEIVKVPASAAPTVARPDDLFALPPGEWHFANPQGDAPCDDKHCEAGFTSGDLVVSVERSEKYIRIIGGLRGCDATAYSELQTGNKPGKSTRKRVAKQVNTVVKGVAKSCSATAPAVPPLDVALLFPPKLSATTDVQPHSAIDAETRRAAKAVGEAADEFEANLSPDERQRLHGLVESNVRRELSAKAADCGTAISFSNAERFEDSEVLIDASATSAQIACVQRQIAFARPQQTSEQ